MVELLVLERTRDRFLVRLVLDSCVGRPMDCMPWGTESRGSTTVSERRGGGGGSGLKVAPPRIRGTWVSAVIFGHLTRAMIVFVTRARESGVAWIRSSRRKRSSGGKPLLKHGSRNFITFDVWNMPSSRGSIRAIDPGRILFISLSRTKMEIRRLRVQGHSLAEDIAISQRFCEQHPLLLFPRIINTGIPRSPQRTVLRSAPGDVVFPPLSFKFGKCLQTYYNSP